MKVSLYACQKRVHFYTHTHTHTHTHTLMSDSALQQTTQSNVPPRKVAFVLVCHVAFFFFSSSLSIFLM
jgi:hypothetical protein